MEVNKKERAVWLGTYVVRSIAVFVNATEECGRGVLAYIPLQETRSARMFVKEIANVVDVPSDTNQRPRLCLTLV